MYTGEAFGLTGSSAQASGILRGAAAKRDQKILNKNKKVETFKNKNSENIFSENFHEMQLINPDKKQKVENSNSYFDSSKGFMGKNDKN
jgi:hypothetical protein